MLGNLVLGDQGLSLTINGGGAAQFDYFWLRDNARDPQSMIREVISVSCLLRLSTHLFGLRRRV